MVEIEVNCCADCPLYEMNYHAHYQVCGLMPDSMRDTFSNFDSYQEIIEECPFKDPDFSLKIIPLNK